jgi:hypothetical protein
MLLLPLDDEGTPGMRQLWEETTTASQTYVSVVEQYERIVWMRCCEYSNAHVDVVDSES